MDKRSKFWLNNYKGFSKAKAEEHKINVYSKHGWERRIKVFSGILDNLLKSGKLKPGNEAVDFGCGTAMYSGIMKDSGLKVTAVDFCLDMLELAKEKRGNAIDYVNSDCSKLPFKDNAFDLAISFGMITIMTDPDPFFSELARVTKPGSLIMIMTLNKLFTSGIFHSERKRGIPLPEDISIIDYNPFHLKKRLEKNPPMELMVAVMLHKRDDSEWTADELAPVKAIQVHEVMPSGSPLGAFITLNNGEEYEIDFQDIDGKRSC